MKACGIIAEYNPLHNGHIYHITETRRVLGDCGIICVMSGNFVQRGEAAMFRKHARARAAVLCGADLVLELPLPWAISSAERFAYGGVSLLEKTGVCTHLAFGSECGDLLRLRAAADCVIDETVAERTRELMKDGVSYARARTEAVKERVGEIGSVLETPNDTLAVEYIKALIRTGADIRPMTVKRVGAAHDGEAKDGYSSASQIRAALMAGTDVWEHVPTSAAEIFQTELEDGRAPVVPESAETAILAKLRTMTDGEFAALPDATEGLDQRFARAARFEPDMMSLIAAVKTKRYALARIRRMITAAYLGVTAADSDGAPPYARVLAANERGRGILSEMSEKGSVPVLTKPAAVRELDERAQRIFELEVRATDMYTLMYPNTAERRGGQEWRISPQII